MAFASNGDLVIATNAVVPRPSAKAIQHNAFGQTSCPDVAGSQRLHDCFGMGNEAAAEPGNFVFLHDTKVNQFLRHYLRWHLFPEGDWCATHHGKLIYRYDPAARGKPVNSAGIDGARLPQVTQEIAPVALAVALVPQVEKGFTFGQEPTISPNWVVRSRQTLARRLRGNVPRSG